MMIDIRTIWNVQLKIYSKINFHANISLKQTSSVSLTTSLRLKYENILFSSELRM